MTGPNTFPKTYVKFTSVRKDGSPGRDFWIQDATEEYFNEIVEQFVTGFLRDEPISTCLNALADIESIQQTRALYHKILHENPSLICLTKNEDGKDILAGFNVLVKVTRDEDHGFNEPTGTFIKFIMDLFNYLDSQNDVFKLFNVDVCLKAMGLYVLPDFRGEGLGAELLKARIPLGKDKGFKVTSTVFTSIISQKQAYKAGFKDNFCIDYEVLAKIKPEFTIPNIQEHTKSIKVMYKLIE